MQTKLRGIHKVKRKLADGTARTHYYAWRGGPKMKSQPGTEGFLLEYARLKQAAADTGHNVQTIEGLIDHFTGPLNPETERPDPVNPDFDRLAASTQKDYLYAFKEIRKQWPKLPIRLIGARGMKKDIREWHRSFNTNPRKADKLLTALSSMLSYAVRDELIEKNPCTGIRKLYKGSRKNAVWGHPIRSPSSVPGRRNTWCGHSSSRSTPANAKAICCGSGGQTTTANTSGSRKAKPVNGCVSWCTRIYGKSSMPYPVHPSIY